MHEQPDADPHGAQALRVTFEVLAVPDAEERTPRLEQRVGPLRHRLALEALTPRAVAAVGRDVDELVGGELQGEPTVDDDDPGGQPGHVALERLGPRPRLAGHVGRADPHDAGAVVATGRLLVHVLQRGLGGGLGDGGGVAEHPPVEVAQRRSLALPPVGVEQAGVADDPLAQRLAAPEHVAQRGSGRVGVLGDEDVTDLVVAHELRQRPAVADDERQPGVQVFEQLVGQRELVPAEVHERVHADVRGRQERRDLRRRDRVEQVQPVRDAERLGVLAQRPHVAGAVVRHADERQVHVR